MNNEQSANNPYAIPNIPKQDQPLHFGSGPQRVPIHVTEIISRAWNLVRAQYWMLLLIVLIGFFLGSLVPMNVLLGAMIVGIYLCFLQVERGEQAEVATLFKSFDQFLDSLIVIIGVTLLNFIMIIPLALVAIGLVVASIPTEPGQEPGIGFVMAVFGIIPFAAAAGFITYLPFLFSFQLIADRKLGALDAIKLSTKAVWMNLGGIILLMIVIGFLSFVLSAMCFVPGVLFMPISVACFWVLYRDVFPLEVAEAALVE